MAAQDFRDSALAFGGPSEPLRNAVTGAVVSCVSGSQSPLSPASLPFTLYLSTIGPPLPTRQSPVLLLFCLPACLSLAFRGKRQKRTRWDYFPKESPVVTVVSELRTDGRQEKAERDREAIVPLPQGPTAASGGCQSDTRKFTPDGVTAFSVRLDLTLKTHFNYM